MTSEQQDWIRKALGPRIDALEMALNGLDPAHAESVANMRRALQTLHATSGVAGITEITSAAALASTGTNMELKGRVAGLIQMLRELGRKAQTVKAAVLLIGSDPALFPPIEAHLKATSRDTVKASSVKEAEVLFRDKEIIFIVADLFLPDQDVRQFISGLRCRPLTASIPIIIVTSKVAADEANIVDLLPDVDGFFGKPVVLEQVYAAMEQRLRRAHERIRAAHRDAVTGLLNRAAFGEYFERAMSHHRETKEPIAIAVMKIDRYQQLIDQHGADVGEKMLRHFGTVLSRYFRATDIVARWGGCEFMALFPGEDNHGATRAIERIREALGREKFTYPDGTVDALKLYAGVSVLPDQATSMAGALDRADKLLFQAGTGGEKVVSPLNQQTKRKERIVLITPSDTTSKVLNHMLLKEGYDVQNFVRVDETSLKNLETTKCHLIILDDSGREQSELDALKKLRELPRQSRTPIILLTPKEENAARALEFGASDFAMKPLDLLAFMKTARRLLTRGVREDLGGTEQDTLLIISADLHTLIIMGTALQKQTGFTVLVGRGGPDGVNQLGKRRPAVTIIDLKPKSKDWQPLMDALVVIRPSPAILLLVDAEDLHYARSIKTPVIKGVITKPVQPLAIARQISDVCGIVPAGLPGRAAVAEILKQEIDRVMHLA